jgi:hypothetical protein
MESQDGGERIEIRTLKDADRIAKEVADSQARRLEDDGEFRTNMEAALGNPTEHLYRQLSRTSSNLERDLIREMIQDLNDEQHRQEVVPESNAFFHWREYDR